MRQRQRVLATTAALVIVAVVAGVLLTSRGELLSSDSGDTVAIVNGTPVSAEAHDVVAEGYLDSGMSPDRPSACEAAIQDMITQTLLSSEIDRRQLSFNPTQVAEAAATLDLRSSMNAIPSLSTTLQSFLDDRGMTIPTYEAAWRANAEALLRQAALTRSIAGEVETPSPGEVATAAANMSQDSTLVLMSMAYPNEASADLAYSEIMDLVNSTPTVPIGSTFLKYGQDHQNLMPGSDDDHVQRFNYASTAALPDYVQQTVGSEEGGIGMVPRSDGSYVVFLVLSNEPASPPDLDGVAGELFQERVSAHYLELVQQLREDSSVDILLNCQAW